MRVDNRMEIKCQAERVAADYDTIMELSANSTLTPEEARELGKTMMEFGTGVGELTIELDRMYDEVQNATAKYLAKLATASAEVVCSPQQG